MPKESAIEILIFKSDPANQRPKEVHENLWIKQRFKQYASIGLYLDGSDLKYYFFEQCDTAPKIYTSLVELKQALPKGLENIFENTPKLFITGHSQGGRYGLGNIHGPSEKGQEKTFLEREKSNYIVQVRKILARAESGEKLAEKDLFLIALGLQDLSVFKNHEDLRDKILANQALLSLVMVTCGKVIISGPSNNSIIDLLLENGISIDSVDEKGMTALHYAIQNLYNYRKEPLNLINKLLEERLADVASVKSDTMASRATPSFFAPERTHSSSDLKNSYAKAHHATSPKPP